jgi:hypothetical protein
MAVVLAQTMSPAPHERDDVVPWPGRDLREPRTKEFLGAVFFT